MLNSKFCCYLKNIFDYSLLFYLPLSLYLSLSPSVRIGLYYNQFFFSSFGVRFERKKKRKKIRLLSIAFYDFTSRKENKLSILCNDYKVRLLTPHDDRFAQNERKKMQIRHRKRSFHLFALFYII